MNTIVIMARGWQLIAGELFPDDDPKRTPVNFWRPFAFLLMSNWINDLYQATPFDLTGIGSDASD